MNSISPALIHIQKMTSPDKTEVRPVSFLIKEQAQQVTLIEKMKHRIDSSAGRRQYIQRMGIVEPVFGNLRYNKRLHRFTIPSHIKVNTQWNKFCLVHNSEKLAHGGYEVRG
ncbi:transposase [Undibacterium sp. CY21W]|uniref:transposase n=1 Tax=Undibacterium sp. CY21W TaxID=2762293 RepID=UPI00164CB097|nr:transposase [Undibacterium sp. CY21W]MBC3928947.1 transposase [Undibacterium sp. CY21W]